MTEPIPLILPNEVIKTIERIVEQGILGTSTSEVIAHILKQYLYDEINTYHALNDAAPKQEEK